MPVSIPLPSKIATLAGNGIEEALLSEDSLCTSDCSQRAERRINFKDVPMIAVTW